MAALKEAARKGRRGDTRLGHLTNGDVVIPAERLNDKTRKLVDLFLKATGVQEPKRFTVGHGQNSRNPKTRLPEFADGGNGGGDSEGGGSGSGGGDAPGNTGPADSQGASAAGLAGASASAGAAPGPGGEIGTGHDLGASTSGIGFGGSTEGQMANMGGTPTASIGDQIAGFLGSQLSNIGFDVGIDNNQVGFNPTGIGLNSNLAATGLNLGIGMVPGLGLANLGLGFLGHDIGHSVVSGVSGMMNGGVSAGTPSGMAGAGGDLGGGAGLDSLGGNIGTGFDDSLLKRRLREA